MALTDESSGIPATMLVGPTGYAPSGYGNCGGFGGFGGDGWWIILLLLAFNGGWGGMGGFGGWGGGFGGAFEFPWLLNGQNQIQSSTADGFRSAQISDSITSVRDGVSALATQLCGCCGDIQNSLCNGFSGVTAAVSGAQNALAQQLYTNQISDLERSFAAQTATTSGMNNIAMNLQNCCCENRAGIADLKYTVATENCADRAALSDGIRDLLAATQAQTQTILTQMCNDKIEQKNDLIAQLRQEVLYARGQASQDVQTARLLAGQTAEVDALYNRLSNCPVPTVPVYGRQPIFTCNNGCGCSGATTTF